jgi:hypothetical protein
MVMAKNWAKKLNKIKMSQGNIPEGKDWFTSEEFMEEIQYGVTKAHKILKSLQEQNKVEVFAGSQWNPNQNQLTRKIWYRFI